MKIWIKIPYFCNTKNRGLNVGFPVGSRGRVARHSSAKARTAVRIRSGPPYHRPGYPGAMDYTKIMIVHFFRRLGIPACIALILTCFLPWVHYNNVDLTFNGYNVEPFSTGNNYGKAGIPITWISSFILVCMMIPKIWAKRLNIFLAAFLMAYGIRTYIIFTSALFENELEKKLGIYLVVILPIIILVSTLCAEPGKQLAKSSQSKQEQA